MSARILASVVCAFFISFLAFSFVTYAQDANPLEKPIDKPIFIDVPDLSSSTLEGKTTLWVYLNYNYDMCKEEYGDNYYQGCNRRLGLEGSKATKGLTMVAPPAGEWRWSSDYTLSFTPSEYWQAGENYTLTIDLDALGVPENVIFVDGSRQASVSFSTKPLKVSFPTMQYMQDPSSPDRKLVSANLTMNYPVATEELKSKLALALEEENGGQLKATAKELEYELKMQADQLSGWLSVPIKKLPDKDRYLTLSIASGLKPQVTGQPSSEIFKQRTRIPSLTSYLAVSQSSAVIARTEDGTPQQLLSLELNTKATPADVLSKTHLYLLPAQHPVTKLAGKTDAKKFFEWKATNQVSAEILKLSEAVPLKLTGNEKDDATQFGFNFVAPSGRYLYLDVDPSLQAFGGYTLTRKYENILQVPEWPNDVEIMQQGSILTLSGARKLSLHARGTDKLSIEVAHIRTEALQHFISQTEGDIRNPSFRNWAFDKEDIARIDTKDVPMNFKAPQESQYAAFDFTSYLKDNRKGLFLLNIQGYKGDKTAGTPQQRFVLVTDLGLLMKEGTKTRDVYLVSFASGKPVKGAELSVLGRNGLSVFDGKTDADGHVALPDFSGFARDRAPVAITARDGNDFTFIPYNRADRQLNLSKFDVGGAVTPSDGLNAFLFSDRGIYRPGETAHLGMIVRNADWQALPDGMPLQVVIRDPRSRVVKDSILKFTGGGLQTADLETGDVWPTGTYVASLQIPGDNQSGNILGSATFRVEDFQPDRLKIKTVFAGTDIGAISSGGWVAPANLDAAVTLTNLYGTPASDRRLTGAVTLNPATLAFPAYQDYSFYDSYPAAPRTIQYDLPDGKTDSDGKATLPLNLEQQPPATYSLNVQTRGFEAGSGRGVTAYSTLLVSPMPYAIGYKTAVSTPTLDYIRQGAKAEIQLQAIAPTLKPLTVADLQLEQAQTTYVSTLVKRDDGSYAYESTPEEKIVKTEKFSLAESGATLALPTDKIGNFVYRLKTADGLVVAAIPFRVAGEGEQAGGGDREAVLNVQTDKKNYGPGEDIELNITAPYTGAGLITLESDHVIAAKWFRTAKTDSIQKISVPREFSGKAYVNVAFIRDINSREIYLSPLSYATVPIIANVEARTASIDLKVPETVKPGTPVTVTYKSNIKGKAVIYAVDEGILQIAKYQKPDPVDFFLINRALQVRTSQMLDLLMPEYDLVRELSAKGGDAVAEAAALGKHLNPFKRKTLAPAVFWSGVVDLDTAEKTLSFTPPGHFNGEMRVIAVATGEDAVGSVEKTLTVRGDLVITPNVPVFLAPGDSAEISATIANNIAGSGKDAQLTLAATATPGVTLTAPAATLAVPEGQEKTVTFKATATETLGPASITVTAALKDLSQSAEATLSIRPPVAKETSLTTGYSKSGSADVKLTRQMYPDFAERSVAVSALPTSYIYGLLRYLDEYPYGCSEQLISKAFPKIQLYGQPEFKVTDAKIEEETAGVIATLRQRQTDSGGIALWPGDDDADSFISIYALDFLIHARSAEMPVPADLVEDDLRYVRNWVNESVRSVDDARTKAYGIYILTSSGMVTTNEILHLLKYFEEQKNTSWKSDLTAVYIASAYKLMQQTELANETMAAFEKSIATDNMDYRTYGASHDGANPFIKYAQYISLKAAHFAGQFTPQDREIVFTLARYVDEQYYSTLSSSYAIQALEDYTSLTNMELAESKFTLTADGTPLTPTGESLLKSEIPVTAKNLTIKGDEPALFYTLSETGFDKSAAGEPLAEKMEISRTYTGTDGKAVSGPVAIGDVIDAEIKIRAHERAVDNVAIVDLLPGGFELDIDTVGTGSSLTPDFVDKREDRVIVFGRVDTDEQVFHYKLRAVAKGTFITPPPYAEAMYDLTTKARGAAGALTVTDPH